VDLVLEPFGSPAMRLALIELLLLSIPAGLLGAQVVLRRMAFFTHGVAGATYPGVVVAGGLGAPGPVGALLAALAFAGGVTGLERRARLASDAATALALIAALALGTLLANDVFASPVSEEDALLGSLAEIGPAELARSAAAAVLAAVATAALGRAWIATAFDPEAAGALGARRYGVSEPLLLVVLAAVAVAAVDAVGALLAGALLVVPAATALLVARSVRGLWTLALVLAATEGTVALWLSARLGWPPGPTLAVISATGFAIVAIAVGALGGRSAARAT
jgi:ABC-type Mn2+/Zn2+ transport system permease subunit